MAAMDEIDYADMVNTPPFSSFVLEYREPSANGVPGRLVGACLTDRQGDGLSMIYSFYDPEHEARTGLGNFIILDHIQRAAAASLPYVYLGYWVDGSARMQYKIRFRPLERLGPAGWQRFTGKSKPRSSLPSRLPARSTARRRRQQGRNPGRPAAYKLA
jgi:arginine-tRNA-protein transferase